MRSSERPAPAILHELANSLQSVMGLALTVSHAPGVDAEDARLLNDRVCDCIDLVQELRRARSCSPASGGGDVAEPAAFR